MNMISKEMIAAATICCMTLPCLNLYGQDRLVRETETAIDRMAERGELSAPEQIKQEMHAILTLMLSAYEGNFRVEVVSPEISQRMHSLIAQHSPLPVQIDKMYLAYLSGEANFQISIAGLPDQMRGSIEGSANQRIAQSEFGRVIDRISINLLKNAAELLLAQDDVAVVRSDDTILDMEATQVNEPFFGDRIIRQIRAMLNRKNRTLDAIRLTFDDGNTLLVQIKYVFMRIPWSDEKIPIPLHMNCTQGINIGGMPQNFVIIYQNYDFNYRP